MSNLPNQKFSYFLLGFFLILILLYCDEEIPQGPPLVPVIAAELHVGSERTVFPQPTTFDNRYSRPQNISSNYWDYLTDHRIKFDVKVTNIFDETIDGLEWTKIKIRLWSTNYLEIKDTLSYTFIKDDPKLFVFHPGNTHNIYSEDSLVWNQTKKNGKSVHKVGKYTPYVVQTKKQLVREIGRRYFYWYCDTTYLAPVDTVLFFDPPIEMKAQADVKIFKNYEAIQSNIFDFKIEYFFPEGFRETNKHRCNALNGRYISSGGK